ncbi:MAG: hypothetical protein LC803_10415 [Acidobacteria bacterium]|nr:hypothetical protein [Acidobacteriota bacterium]
MSNTRDITGVEERHSPAGSTGLSTTAKKVGIYLGVALAIFLLGFLPMWFKASANASQRDAAQRELRLSRMHGMLASAVIDARRGEYEPARQTTSDFFTALRAQIDAGGDSALTTPQREGAAPLLARRDDVITLLARGDPASAEQLTDIYVSYRKAVNEVGVK